MEKRVGRGRVRKVSEINKPVYKIVWYTKVITSGRWVWLRSKLPGEMAITSSARRPPANAQLRSIKAGRRNCPFIQIQTAASANAEATINTTSGGSENPPPKKERTKQRHPIQTGGYRPWFLRASINRKAANAVRYIMGAKCVAMAERQ